MFHIIPHILWYLRFHMCRCFKQMPGQRWPGRVSHHTPEIAANKLSTAVDIQIGCKSRCQQSVIRTSIISCPFLSRSRKKLDGTKLFPMHQIGASDSCKPAGEHRWKKTCIAWQHDIIPFHHSIIQYNTCFISFIIIQWLSSIDSIQLILSNSDRLRPLRLVKWKQLTMKYWPQLSRRRRRSGHGLDLSDIDQAWHRPCN